MQNYLIFVNNKIWDVINVRLDACVSLCRYGCAARALSLA